jgi:hypothetical protein
MKQTLKFALLLFVIFLNFNSVIISQGNPIQLALFDPIQIVPSNESISGVRLNLIYSKNANVTGFDVGLVNVTTGKEVGVQWGGVNVTDGGFTGWQSAFINISGEILRVYKHPGLTIIAGISTVFNFPL